MFQGTCVAHNILVASYRMKNSCQFIKLNVASLNLLFFSLLMYGCMALMNERYEEAETFFEAATCTESKSVIAWTMLGIKTTLILENLFSNSLIIHEEKTKEISTMNEVWICDPNYHKIR